MFAKKRPQWLEKIRSKDIVNTELHNAILLQRQNDVEKALENGADPNSRDSTTKEPAIFPACAGGNIEITRTLLRWGANPNIIWGEKPPRIVPLILAVIYNRTAICKVLLSFGADPNGPPELETWACEMLSPNDGRTVDDVKEEDRVMQQEEKPVYHAAMGKRMSISVILLSDDWKKLYSDRVKESLVDILERKFNLSVAIPVIVEFLPLNAGIDLKPITDRETWEHLRKDGNPTLKLYIPYIRNLSQILERVDKSFSIDQLVRFENSQCFENTGSEMLVEEDISKFPDDSDI